MALEQENQSPRGFLPGWEGAARPGERGLGLNLLEHVCENRTVSSWPEKFLTLLKVLNYFFLYLCVWNV